MNLKNCCGVFDGFQGFPHSLMIVQKEKIRATITFSEGLELYNVEKMGFSGYKDLSEIGIIGSDNGNGRISISQEHPLTLKTLKFFQDQLDLEYLKITDVIGNFTPNQLIKLLKNENVLLIDPVYDEEIRELITTYENLGYDVRLDDNPSVFYWYKQFLKKDE